MESFLHLYNKKMEPIQEQILVGRQEETLEVKREEMLEVKLKGEMLEEDKMEKEEKREDRQVDKEII